MTGSLTRCHTYLNYEKHECFHDVYPRLPHQWMYVELFACVVCILLTTIMKPIPRAHNSENTNTSISQQPENPKHSKETKKKMAALKKADYSSVSKTELAEIITRYKARDKKSREKAKKATEQLTADLVTVGSGAAMGYLMGYRVVNADRTKENYLEEATQIVGVDYDLAISGAVAAIGLTGMGGGMSDFLRSVGIGGLTAYAGRRAFFGAIEANETEEKDNFFKSGSYAPWGAQSKA